MAEPVFVLDSNVFIEAARRYYAFDLGTKFWDSLISFAKDGRICSIDRVKQELNRGKDDLAEWVNHQFYEAFASTDEEKVIASFREIMTWVNNQGQFLPSAKSDFANGADGWLIAYAMVKNYEVVTQEVLKPDIRNKVPIPNVCQAFNVKFGNTFDMLRQLGVRLA
jgi:hypothetical protein